MSPLNPPLNKEDFFNSDWQDIFEKSEIKVGTRSHLRIGEKVANFQNNDSLREKAVFELLKLITAPIIVAEGKSEHFVDIFDGFTEEELSFLAEIVSEIPEPELQARIADILWIKKYLTKSNCYQMAKLAINAYMESAKNLESAGLLHINSKDIEFNDLFYHCFQKIQRAWNLAYEINDEIEKNKIVEHSKLLIERYNQVDSRLAANLMELLIENKLDDPSKYTAWAEKNAKSAEANSDWYEARGYWELKAKWHKLEKNKQKEFSASILAAETYVKESEDYIKKEPKSYLGASTSIEEAYVAFRKIPDQTAKLRAEQCHKLLLEYQEKAHQEIVSTGIRYDLTQVIPYEQYEIQARESVKDKNFQNALFTIATLVNIQKITDLRVTVEKCLKDDLFPLTLPYEMVNGKGKTVAKKTGIDFNTKESVEDSIKFKMNQDASLIYGIHATTLIEPAREQITLEHEISVKDLLFLVKDKRFVPSEREYLFAKGLYAGLIGDFFTSTHLLIPQIENSVRHLLWQKGFIPSGYKSGIQNEHDLNKTLYRPEIKTIFDEDTLFTLKCLLVEHSGCNLRNRMAHGLIDDHEFQPGVMSYLWWLTLRLCCLPMLNYQEELEKSNSLLKFTGTFEDDPFFDEFVEAMADNRQQLEIEMANVEDEEIRVA
jgi:hypothetical protein